MYRACKAQISVHSRKESDLKSLKTSSLSSIQLNLNDTNESQGILQKAYKTQICILFFIIISLK